MFCVAWVRLFGSGLNEPNLRGCLECSCAAVRTILSASDVTPIAPDSSASALNFMSKYLTHLHATCRLWMGTPLVVRRTDRHRQLRWDSGRTVPALCRAARPKLSSHVRGRWPPCAVKNMSAVRYSRQTASLAFASIAYGHEPVGKESRLVPSSETHSMNSPQNLPATASPPGTGGMTHLLVLARRRTVHRYSIRNNAHELGGPMNLYSFVDRKFLVIANHVDIEIDCLREAVPEQSAPAPSVDYEFIRIPYSTGSAAFARCAGDGSQSPAEKCGPNPVTGRGAWRDEHGDDDPESVPAGVTPWRARGGAALRMSGVDAGLLRSSSTRLGSSGSSSSWWPGSGSSGSC
jgi:hypothetical protein